MASQNVLDLVALTKDLFAASGYDDYQRANDIKNEMAPRFNALNTQEDYDFHVEVAALVTNASVDDIEKMVEQECESNSLMTKFLCLRNQFSIVAAIVEEINTHRPNAPSRDFILH